MHYERHPESMRTVPWLRPAGCDSGSADELQIDAYSRVSFCGRYPESLYSSRCKIVESALQTAIVDSNPCTKGSPNSFIIKIGQPCLVLLCQTLAVSRSSFGSFWPWPCLVLLCQTLAVSRTSFAYFFALAVSRTSLPNLGRVSYFFCFLFRLGRVSYFFSTPGSCLVLLLSTFLAGSWIWDPEPSSKSQIFK